MRTRNAVTAESAGAGQAQATPPPLWKALALGLVAGLLSGLFGVGGGILIVPGLVLALRMPQRLAHGTSLAAIIPIAASGLVGYGVAGEVDWLAALCLAVGAAGAGAGIGTRLLHRWRQRTLALCFALLLVATAARLLWETGAGSARPDLDALLVVQLLVLGVASGVLAGLTGVGGGTVMVPAMVVLLGFPTVLAKGISLGAMIPTAIVGSTKNMRRQNLDLRTAVIIGAAGVASSYAGSQISLGLDSTVSNRLFALLLTAIALKTAWDNRRAAPAEPAPGPVATAVDRPATG